MDGVLNLGPKRTMNIDINIKMLQSSEEKISDLGKLF